MKMSLKNKLLVEYLLPWAVRVISVNTHSPAYWGFWQVPLGPLGVLETDTSTSDQTGL